MGKFAVYAVPILKGAAIGAAVSAATGGDPLKGALTGGVTGGIGAKLQGIEAASSSGGMFDSFGDMVGDVTTAGASGAGSTAGSIFGGLSTLEATKIGLGGVAVASMAGAQAQAGLDAQSNLDFQAAIYDQQSAREAQRNASLKRDFLNQQSGNFGTRVALLGRSGGRTDKGSLLNVSRDYENEVAYQAAKIQNFGQTSQTRLQQSAQLARLSGANVRSAGFRRAGSTVLLGGAQLASQFI